MTFLDFGLSACPPIRNNLLVVTLSFIDLAGTPATISSSSTLFMTVAPEPTITLFPIFILCFNVEFCPSQHVSPIIVLPPMATPAEQTQFLPISTL